MKNIIILIYFSLTIIFCQTELIKMGSDGVIEIIDQRLLPEYWFLSDTNNIKKLNQEKYNIFKSELDKMTADYKKEILTDFHKEIVWVTYSTGETYTIPGLYEEYIYRGYSKQEAYQLSHGTRTKDVQEGKKRIIDYNKQLWTKTVEWVKIVEYLGGYSELRKTGITKDKKSLFDIESELVSIELTSPNSCIANVKIKGDKKYGLKFYKVPKTEYKYKGTYSIDEIHYPEIFALSKSLKNEDDVKNLIPNIHFLFEDKEYMPKQKITIPLNKIDKDIVSAAIPYVMTMRQMIDDLIPYDEYIKMEHIKYVIEKDLEQNNKECDEAFRSFQKECIEKFKEYINYSLRDRISNRMIKKYKKKNSHPIIGSFHQVVDATKGLDGVIEIPMYSREFLEYFAGNNKSNRVFIRSSLQTLDKIKSTTNIIVLLFILCKENPVDEIGKEMTIRFRHVDGREDHERKSENQRRVEYLINNLRLEKLRSWFIHNPIIWESFNSCNLSYMYLLDMIKKDYDGILSHTVNSPQIVEALNNTLLDMDRNQTSEESTGEVGKGWDYTDPLIIRLKQDLDTGKITQEQFDTAAERFTKMRQIYLNKKRYD